MLQKLCLALSMVTGAILATRSEGDETAYARAAELLVKASKAPSIDDMRAGVSAAQTELEQQSFVRQSLTELLTPLTSTAPDGAPVVDAIRKQLADLAADLAFRPQMEAEFPEGFPEFTPVGEVEIKKYPAYRMVRTKISQDAAASGSNTAFFRLFSHIQQNQIAMTTPVEMEFAEDQSALRQSSMAFLYGSPDLGHAGVTGETEVVDVSGLTVITTGVRGRPAVERIDVGRQRLEQWLEKNTSRYQRDGNLRVMGYNSPFIPDSRAYFEVQYPVQVRDTNPQSRDTNP